MHTLMILGGGFGLGSALIAYIVVWVAISAYNMWVGVNHAGYSYRALSEEKQLEP